MIRIQILGLGCPKCANLAQRTEQVAERLGLLFSLEKVNDLHRIIEAGANVPALVIDGKVCSQGLVPVPSEIETFLKAAAGMSTDVPAQACP